MTLVDKILHATDMAKAAGIKVVKKPDKGGMCFMMCLNYLPSGDNRVFRIKGKKYTPQEQIENTLQNLNDKLDMNLSLNFYIGFFEEMGDSAESVMEDYGLTNIDNNHPDFVDGKNFAKLLINEYIARGGVLD